MIWKRRISMALAIAGGAVAPAHAQTPAKPPTAPVQAARPAPGAAAVAPKPDPGGAVPNPETAVAPPAELDKTRRKLQALFAHSGLQNMDSKKAETALLETLHQGRQELVKIGPPVCRTAGCYVDVEYPSMAAFLDFDKSTVGRPNRAFDTWDGANGRTGLLRKGKSYIATWYFLFQPDTKSKGSELK
jgi:hypothetical protein